MFSSTASTVGRAVRINMAAAHVTPAVCSARSAAPVVRKVSSAAVPATTRKIRVKQLSTNFREATEIVNEPVSVGPKDLLVSTAHMGINASDINFTAGRYNPGVPPPFDAGFEGTGHIVAVGSEVKHFKVGDAVGYMTNGAFAEYIAIPAARAVPLPSVNPEYISLMVSGLTASIALEKVGEIQKNNTVLVTAAAGGTGQFAVQIAKLAGCHVIGTCSSDEKASFLKGLGVDRAINYKKEDLNKVLKTEYPNGIDVVYESVGGDTFEVCVNRLAPLGRIIVIGFITGYNNDQGFTSVQTGTLLPKLLTKSASVRGFFLFNYANAWKEHTIRLLKLHGEGKIKATIDPRSARGDFVGLDAVAPAVEYLHSGKSFGKVVVNMPSAAKTKSSL